MNGATGGGRPKHKVIYAHNGVPVKNVANTASAGTQPAQPAKVDASAVQGRPRLDRPITHPNDLAQS